MGFSPLIWGPEVVAMNRSRDTQQESESTNEQFWWKAVQAKDARFNSVFVYAVRSTGIYCKPSCPSKRPRQGQVVFFSSCDAAEQSGFRACRRCKPRQTQKGDPHVETVLRACRAIEAEVDGPVSLAVLGKKLSISPHHLHRIFKKITGITPRQYAAAHRLKMFKSHIRNGEDVTSAIYGAGYGSSSRLYENASEQLGMTPAVYRRGGKGMIINYTIVNCHLGRLLVAATERGVCAISFGEEDGQLEYSLAAEYPAAVLRRDERHINNWVDPLLNHLNGSQQHLDLPVDLQATAFQLRVWEELRRIPYGETRTYGDIARGLGRPTANRAVARACAANPVALINPCHRVIRADGELGGYRWGLRRKKALLSMEENPTKRD